MSAREINVEDVSEDSPLVRLLETKSRVKILDTMLRHSYAPLTEREIADYSGVNQSTVNRNISVFEDLNLVAQVDDWPAMYRLVNDHPVVEGFEQAQLHLLGHSERLKESDVRRRGDEHAWVSPEDPSPEQFRELVRANPHLVDEVFRDLRDSGRRSSPPQEATSTAA